MYELVRIHPVKLLFAIVDSPSVEIAYSTARWNPQDTRDHDSRADNVVLQEAHHFVDVYVFDDVPESLDDVLYGLLASSLIAEAVYAGCTIRQDVLRVDGEAGIV